MRYNSLLIFVILMAGCGLIYKQDIQQGNVLESEHVESLSTGMSKRQVLVLLGSPSVASPFHADQWDYVNTFAKRGGKPDERRLSLKFENDRLVSVSGNYLDELELADGALREMEDRTRERAFDDARRTSRH